MTTWRMLTFASRGGLTQQSCALTEIGGRTRLMLDSRFTAGMIRDLDRAEQDDMSSYLAGERQCAR